jgi:hypothetical protein
MNLIVSFVFLIVLRRFPRKNSKRRQKVSETLTCKRLSAILKTDRLRTFGFFFRASSMYVAVTTTYRDVGRETVQAQRWLPPRIPDQKSHTTDQVFVLVSFEARPSQLKLPACKVRVRFIVQDLLWCSKVGVSAHPLQESVANDYTRRFVNQDDAGALAFHHYIVQVEAVMALLCQPNQMQRQSKGWGADLPFWTSDLSSHEQFLLRIVWPLILLNDFITLQEKHVLNCFISTRDDRRFIFWAPKSGLIPAQYDCIETI